MRAIRAASAALLAAAALGLAVVPTALAAGNDGNDGNEQNITSFGFSVTPVTVVPGGTVTLTSDGCEVPSVTVTSGVFDTVTLSEGRSGTATVDLAAKAGARYEITFDCKGERGTTALTVVAPTGAHKGVKAGFGSEAGAVDGGLGTAELVTGALLIAGALGAAVVLIRRRGTAGA
ncbi:hypothetical protein ABZY68_03370 [Streptomyces sp. NPDC006482]|uniref:hypothetical protein n=1 Tax=Streptomyces sp. NPDC006482 TaxID=3154306 RepID=UPI0033AEDE5F